MNVSLSVDPSVFGGEEKHFPISYNPLQNRFADLKLGHKKQLFVRQMELFLSHHHFIFVGFLHN